MASTTLVEVPTQAAVCAADAPCGMDTPVDEEDATELSERTYLGVVKSYNDRRGFGFVACAEIVAQLGRDVYLPKLEAAQAVMGGTEPAKMAEDDILQFRMRKSVEGYPQAVEAKRLHKFRGTVVSAPSVDAHGVATAGLVRSSEFSEALVVQPETVGRLRLVEGDEVSFCVHGSPGAEPLEAQLVCLESTKRPAAAVLGLFACRLPRDRQRPDSVLQCHAFRDRVVVTELPADATEAELLHFFSKQGATGVTLTRWAGAALAAAQFPGVGGVSRLLSSAVHAFADDTETRVGVILEGAPVEQQPLLPALPRPALAAGQEPGVLQATWSPSVIASRYILEIRAAGTQAAWIAIDDSTGNMRRSECFSCRVAGLPTSVPFEARVFYATDCDTRSEASESSEWCVAVPRTKPEDRAPVPLPAAAFPSQAASVMAPLAAWTAPSATWPAPNAAVDAAARGGHAQQFAAATDMACAMAQAVQAGAMHGAQSTLVQPSACGAGWQCTHSPMVPAPLVTEAVAMPTAVPAPAPAQPCAPSAGWQYPPSAIIPAPPVPEVHWADEAGSSVLVRWASTPGAAAYAVELQEAGGSASERFVRQAAPSAPGCPVDLQIGGLRQCAPGGCYMAQIRCICFDGSESAPSAPGWTPPRTISVQPAMQAAAATQSCVPGSNALPRLLRGGGQPLSPAGMLATQQEAKVEQLPMVAMPFGVQDMQAAFANGAMFGQGFQNTGGLFMQTVPLQPQPNVLMLD